MPTQPKTAALLRHIYGEMEMNKVLAGIDIGGTKIAVALATPAGEIVAQRFLATQPELGPHAILENVSQAISELCSESGGELASIGVGSPAPIDVTRGLIMSPSNLLDWIEFPVVDLLIRSFGVPVMLDNDANAAALGEYMYGAGRGYRNIFYITFSTGIGGGIVINGEVYHGVCTSAGEIGHTIVQPDGVRCNCGSIGCLESICAGVSIARRAMERLMIGDSSLMTELVSNIDEITAKTVVEAVRQGDRVASEIWDETCRYLAIGIGNAITLLAPEIVIIGGGVAAAGDILFEPLRKLVPQYVSMIPADRINISPAELGAESGVRGALAIAKKAFSNSYLANAA